MTKKRPTTPLDKATALLDRLRMQEKRTRKRLRDIELQIYKAKKAVNRERVKLLIGKPVKYATWRSERDRNAWLNTAVGTLLKVNIRYGEVDYGERGKWRIPIDEIMPADDARTAIEMDAFLAGGKVTDEWLNTAVQGNGTANDTPR